MSIGADSAAPWTSFWAWWTGAAPRIAQAIDSRTVGELIEEISGAVHAINPRLAWELGPGRSAKHAFTLSPEGDIELRRLTERWIRSAPPPDVWEYFAARQPARELTLEMAGRQFRSDEWRFGVDVDDQRLLLHVHAHHPALGRCPKRQRPNVAFIAIDQLFGEDLVEKWIGSIDVSETRPQDPMTASEVDWLIANLARESAKEVFTLARGEDEFGRPLFLNFNARLKRLDHLFAETRIQVDLTLRQPTDQGLTTDAEAIELDAFEDGLVAAAGPAVYVGRMTGRGQRNLHLYVENARPAWDAVEQFLSERAAPWKPVLNWEADPRWEFYREGLFRTFKAQP